MHDGYIYNTLFSRPGGKRPLWKPRLMCEDDVKCILENLGLMVWAGGGGSCEHGDELSDSITE